MARAMAMARRGWSTGAGEERGRGMCRLGVDGALLHDDVVHRPEEDDVEQHLTYAEMMGHETMLSSPWRSAGGGA